MKTKTVTAFASVSEAVKHAGMDLSYNKSLALRDLNELDQESRSSIRHGARGSLLRVSVRHQTT